jgi:hypothetical protein
LPGEDHWTDVGTLVTFETAEKERADNRTALFRMIVYAEHIMRERPPLDEDVQDYITLTRAASEWLLQRRDDLPRLQCQDAIYRWPLEPP